MFYIVTLNYDYNETVHAFSTRAEAVDFIATEFELSPEIERDSAEFWEAVCLAYQSDDWKGAQFLVVTSYDPPVIKQARGF